MILQHDKTSQRKLNIKYDAFDNVTGKDTITHNLNWTYIPDYP